MVMTTTIEVKTTTARMLKQLKKKYRSKSMDETLRQLAGEINHKRKKIKTDWGTTDSIVLATARTVSAKVVTGDWPSTLKVYRMSSCLKMQPQICVHMLRPRK